MKKKITNKNNNNVPQGTLNDIEDDEVSDDDETGDFEPPEEPTQKDKFVTLTVDRKRLAKETAITAKRHKIGVTAQRDMLANIINVGGGNVDDFSLSNYTVRMAGTVTVKEAAEKIKMDFKTVLEEDHNKSDCVIIYFDGKSLPQFHDQIKSVKKRISVIADSPTPTL